TDLSGNGFDVTTIIANRQPRWIPEGMNGHPVLRFDGFDDLLRGVNPGLAAGGSFTILVAARSEQTELGGYAFGLEGGPRLQIGVAPSGNFSAIHSGYWPLWGKAADLEPVLFVVRFEDGRASMISNGRKATEVEAYGDFLPGSITSVGAVANFPWKGDIAEI